MLVTNQENPRSRFLANLRGGMHESSIGRERTRLTSTVPGWQLFIILIGVTIFRTWFGVVEPILRGTFGSYFHIINIFMILNYDKLYKFSM